MHRGRLAIGLVAVSFMLGGVSRAVYAEGPQLCPVCLKANDNTASYPEKAGNALLRGAMNTAFGWTEMIRQPAEEAKGGGNLLVGVAKGLGQSVARTVTGLADLFTFWTPKIQGQYIHFAKDCPLDTTQ